MNDTDNILLEHTSSIVRAALSGGQAIATGAIPALIASTHAALAATLKPAEPAVPEITRPTPAVSVRSSVKPDAITSLIDGKPYKTLKRHITRHGYTPESYRAAFGLPASYPMVAPAYSEARRGMAMKIGLGRKH